MLKLKVFQYFTKKNYLCLLNTADEDEGMDAGDSMVQETASDLKSKTVKAKLLKFCENRRPAYWGTWSKKSKSICARRPFARDVRLLFVFFRLHWDHRISLYIYLYSWFVTFYLSVFLCVIFAFPGDQESYILIVDVNGLSGMSRGGFYGSIYHGVLCI